MNMNQQFGQKRIFRQFIAILLLMSIGVGALSAQTKARTTAAPAKTPAKAGWSGVITYSKTLSDTFTSDEKLLGSLDDRERIKHNDTRKYSYHGNLVVNDFAGTGRAATRSKITFRDSSTDKVLQTELTRCHSWEDDRVVKAESSDRRITTGTGEGEASYNLSVNGDKFNFSFTFPDFQGKFVHNTSATYSNLCPDSTRKPSATTNENEARIERDGAKVEGEIDPKDPDVIEGTKVWKDGITADSKGFVHIVTYRLRRKPQPLMITDVRFYEPLYPSPSDWHEIGDSDRAVDGNQVKIVATVANFGATEKTATVNFKELKENVALPDGPVTVTIPPNSQKDVELIWDTSGYAWRQSGANVVPETERQIEVRIPDDSMQKDLTVIPKPVVLVWGFWQSADAFNKFRDYFKAVSDKWGFWAARTHTHNISTDNADILDEDIRSVQKGENAWHVDLVGVQNGGLTARVYVNSKMPTTFDGRPTATHLVMMGTPNMGTPCATGLYGLSFKINTFNMDAVAELSPESMKRFNLLVNNTNGTKFAALAGGSRDSTCQEDVPGDGFAPTASAVWRIKTNFVSTAKVNTRDFIGEVSHFRQVYRWLAVPPKGDHAPDPSTLGANFSRDNLSESNNALFANVNFTDESDPRPEFAKVVTIPKGRPLEIEIPARGGARFSVVLLASPDVSATLIDEKGEVVGTNLADSPEAAEIFRTITVKRSFPAGKWKLRLESRATEATEAGVTAFVDYGAKVSSGEPVAE
jgi:hypothetical protein